MAVTGLMVCTTSQADRIGTFPHSLLTGRPRLAGARDGGTADRGTLTSKLGRDCRIRLMDSGFFNDVCVGGSRNRLNIPLGK